MKQKALIAAVAVACAVGFAQTSSALTAEFFAEDLNVFSESTGLPTGNGYANSQAAEASFLAMLTGVGTEDFESFADGTTGPLALTFPGAGTATLGGDGEIEDDPVAGRNAISGTTWWETAYGEDFTITFSEDVAAFGFYGVDIGDFSGTIELTLANGSSYSVVLPTSSGSTASGNVIFYGYINTDSPFSSATFDATGSSDIFGFDDMTIGKVEQVVATPDGGTTLLLLGSALASVAALRRKLGA